MHKFVAALLATAPMALTAQPVPAPAPRASLPVEPFSAPDAQAVVPALAQSLEDNFVFPDTAHKYAAMLRAKLASGAYSSFPDKASFAKAVTDDLQSVAHDGHLRLFTPAMMERIRSGAPSTTGSKPDTFIEKSGWLAPGVAYISYLAFMGDEPTLRATREFLASHANAKVLIIDARRHHGGGTDEMDLLFSQLFAKKTALLDMDTRQAAEERSPEKDPPSISKIKGPAGVVRRLHSAIPAANRTALSTAKVYLLTSNKTGSAGEHLALALKATGRATLIGETTHGAGNYGHPFKLPVGYAAFIPIGRTFDPRTGKGWEGTGVAPNIAVPADQALDRALQLAGVKATAQESLASLR